MYPPDDIFLRVGIFLLKNPSVSHRRAAKTLQNMSSGDTPQKVVKRAIL